MRAQRLPPSFVTRRSTGVQRVSQSWSTWRHGAGGGTRAGGVSVKTDGDTQIDKVDKALAAYCRLRLFDASAISYPVKTSWFRGFVPTRHFVYPSRIRSSFLPFLLLLRTLYAPLHLLVPTSGHQRRRRYIDIGLTSAPAYPLQPSRPRLRFYCIGSRASDAGQLLHHPGTLAIASLFAHHAPSRTTARLSSTASLTLSQVLHLRDRFSTHQAMQLLHSP